MPMGKVAMPVNKTVHANKLVGDSYLTIQAESVRLVCPDDKTNIVLAPSLDAVVKRVEHLEKLVEKLTALLALYARPNDAASGEIIKLLTEETQKEFVAFNMN